MRIERIFTFLTVAYMNICNEYVLALSIKKKTLKKIFKKKKKTNNPARTLDLAW